MELPRTCMKFVKFRATGANIGALAGVEQVDRIRRFGQHIGEVYDLSHFSTPAP
jgi:hypothetical protein